MSQPTIEVNQATVAGQQQLDGQQFPLVLECHAPAPSLSDTAAWIRSAREVLLAQASRHGAILFRGFPMSEAQDFDTFIAAFGLVNFPYYESLSNAVRKNWTERVFSANEAPPEVTIYLHHEMAQTPVFPAKLFFFCQQPADEGGATPVCRSDVLLEQLAGHCPRFVRDCEQKGLQYTNVMPGEDDPQSGMGRSWQSTLGAESREQAERRLQSLGYSWEWLPKDCLRATTPVLPAVREVFPGRKAFFNQLIAAFRGWKDARNDPSSALRHGDGTPLDREAVGTAIRLAEELSFDVYWQRGDAVLIDNFLTMHGRRTFRGKRQILASLADPHWYKPLPTASAAQPAAR